MSTNRKDRRAKKAVTAKVAKHAPAVQLFVQTNDQNIDVQIEKLKMFYKGVLANTIGFADVLDSRTGLKVSVLTGLAPDGKGGLQVVPIAKIIDDVEEMKAYLAPDYQGGWGAPLVGSDFVDELHGFAEQHAAESIAKVL